MGDSEQILRATQPPRSSRARICACDQSRPSRAAGVGSNPIKPLAFVGRADTRSAEIGSPDGIFHSFQVSPHSTEPFTSIRARNLFAKDDWKSALGDEVEKSGPKVSFIGVPLLFAADRKRLTGTGAGADRLIVGPSGKAEGVGPAKDATEKVMLHKSLKV